MRKNWLNEKNKYTTFSNRKTHFTKYQGNKRAKPPTRNTKKDSSTDYSSENNKNKDDYNNVRIKNASEMAVVTNDMKYSGKDLEEIVDVNVVFVDKDNYNKYLNIKKSSQIISTFIWDMFGMIYQTIILLLFVNEIIKILLKKNLIGIEINWGILLTPVIIIGLFKSFNTYSFIKISF